ncbi:HD domain containing hypothetical protein [Phytophthora palmivora]|uniref:HD/PDEase domain-containing protein n=1 Tax=Phytophthora palmivora TaxID=4796 RepID=A0A2P4XAC4_9STRA|nr:HD domain containing hypothetical protein [Phytophthora palmivora]
MSTSTLVERAALFVKEQLKTNDASHDWYHIERVWKMARTLAQEENVATESMEIIDLAALLHDIDDWKYQSDNTNPTCRSKEFLQSENISSEKLERVMVIVDNIGFKDELDCNLQISHSVEFGCVQDADRLDGIGAIGIARCFTYGGYKKHPHYDPEILPNHSITKEQYMVEKRPNTSINHFYEKLLKLRGMMKTNAGTRIAEERHAFMERFLDQFHKEIGGITIYSTS